MGRVTKMPKKYIDARGWKYQVMSGIGSDPAFKARYQKPEKQGDVGWKGLEIGRAHV